MATRKMATTKNVLSTVASVAATAMLIRTIANDFLPTELRNYIFSGIQTIFHNYSSEFTIVIEEFRGLSLNQVFEAADTYLGTKSIESTQRVRLGKAENEKNLAITIDRNQDIVDVYEGVAVKWKLICKKAESGRHGGEYMRDMNAALRSEIRSYELSFHKEHKKKVLSSYLPYILEKSKAIKEESKAIKLHTVTNHRWASNAINLDHPMTFKTLAMDSKLKDTILEDLDNFIKGEEFYRRIGKAWKRGYLLYGPPGTGKSSLIAAMANYLNFDIYDLDLTAVKSNSQLRKMLLSMPSRSILVIEDIDCTVNLQNRVSEDKKPRDDDENEVTLSGLLNFIDGLWSCCGNERIIIFTTNHKDRLDPALLRPGRMDVHIHISYCTISAFKQLAFNYLRISHHHLFDQIEEILTKAEVTPAEVAGELMKNCDEQVSLQALLQLLNNKIAVKNEEKTKADMESIK